MEAAEGWRRRCRRVGVGRHSPEPDGTTTLSDGNSVAGVGVARHIGYGGPGFGHMLGAVVVRAADQRRDDPERADHSNSDPRPVGRMSAGNGPPGRIAAGSPPSHSLITAW